MRRDMLPLYLASITCARAETGAIASARAPGKDSAPAPRQNTPCALTQGSQSSLSPRRSRAWLWEISIM